MNSQTPPARLAHVRRLLTVIYFALFATVGVYWAVLETLAPNLEPRDPGVIKNVLQGLGAAVGAGVLYLRFSRIPSAIDLTAPDPGPGLARLQMYYIVSYALTEAVALYGFVLRLLGGTREESALFFFAAAGLFLLCYPRLPEDPGPRM
ncbi:MAG: hypothetical protein ACRESV_06740 [Nevskiales bacterium]